MMIVMLTYYNIARGGDIMEGLQELKEAYLAMGVGGLSFIVLLSVLWFLLKSVKPTLEQIRQDGAVTQSVIQNNTRAIEEMSKSNQNVAMALTILDKSMSNVHSDIKEIKEANDRIEHTLLVLETKIK